MDELFFTPLIQAVFYLIIIDGINVPDINFKITVLDHKIKTSSTFLVTLKMKDLIFPTSFSVFSNQIYAFYINRNIYIYNT